jgi:hypothetical protein
LEKTSFGFEVKLVLKNLLIFVPKSVKITTLVIIPATVTKIITHMLNPAADPKIGPARTLNQHKK